MNEFCIYHTDERLLVHCAWDIGLFIDKAVLTRHAKDQREMMLAPTTGRESGLQTERKLNFERNLSSKI